MTLGSVSNSTTQFQYWKDNPSDERRAVGYFQPDVTAITNQLSFRRARSNPFAQINMQFVLDVQDRIFHELAIFFEIVFELPLELFYFKRNPWKSLNEESGRFIWYELFTEINIRAMMNVYRLTNDIETKVK